MPQMHTQGKSTQGHSEEALSMSQGETPQENPPEL